jgi:hypothetical protein
MVGYNRFGGVEIYDLVGFRHELSGGTTPNLKDISEVLP